MVALISSALPRSFNKSSYNLLDCSLKFPQKEESYATPELLYRFQKYPDFSSGTIETKPEPASACYSKFRSIRANTTVGSTATAATVTASAPLGFSRPLTVEPTTTSFLKPEMPGPSTSAVAYRGPTTRTITSNLPTMVKPRSNTMIYKEEALRSSLGELVWKFVLRLREFVCLTTNNASFYLTYFQQQNLRFQSRLYHHGGHGK